MVVGGWYGRRSTKKYEIVKKKIKKKKELKNWPKNKNKKIYCKIKKQINSKTTN